MRFERHELPAVAASCEGATCCGPLLFDHAAREVRVDDRPLLLTMREYELLQFLALNPSRVYPRQALLTILGSGSGSGSAGVGARAIDAHVRAIRAKLGPELRDCIRTVRGVGYGFCARAMATAADRHRPEWHAEGPGIRQGG